MCFSAKISFLSSALLLIVGILSLKNIKKNSHVFFALIPILFSLQQFAEGFVWVTEPDTFFNTLFAYIYLGFAMFVWPVWMPLSLFYLEKIQTRRRIIFGLFLTGIAWGCFVIWHALTHNIFVQLNQNHVRYIVSLNENKRSLLTLIYLIPGTGPFFISSIPFMSILGATLVVSCFLTYIIWYKFFISLWCFFAAVMSMFVLFLIKKEKV